MNIVWMDDAIGDLERLHAFLNPKSHHAATRMRGALILAGEGLRVFPGRGRPGPVEHTREIVAGDYVLIYRIADTKTLHILRVFHGKEKR